MVERNPWWKRVEGPFPDKYDCLGVKDDGGGSMRGRGIVGEMRIHRAVVNKNADLLRKLVEEGHDVNEVEAAGNTPLHNAAYFGWLEGAELLIELGAKVNASNNAGDSAYIWAENMGQKKMMEFLESKGAEPDYVGQVIVPEHIPKVKNFYDGNDAGKKHPKPSQEYLLWKKQEEDIREAYHAKIIPGYGYGLY